MRVQPLLGGNTLEVVNKGLKVLKGRKIHQIYLIAGVKDMTCKLGTKEVTPIFNNWSLLVRHMMIQCYKARAHLYSLSDRVIVCELTGLHLGLYNTSCTQYLPQQNILNNGVLQINVYIAEMNGDDAVYSPYFAGYTHKMKGAEKIHHCYVQTTYGGLHFHMISVNRMANNLVQNICDLYLDHQTD